MRISVVHQAGAVIAFMFVPVRAQAAEPLPQIANKFAYEIGYTGAGKPESIEVRVKAKNIRTPVTWSVEAVEKVFLRKLQIRVRNLASQNRLHGTNSDVGMVNVPRHLPLALRRGVFLQHR